MPFNRGTFSFLAPFLFSISLFGQQVSTTNTQALLLLQQASTVVNPGVSVSDVTLSGTARRIAGADDETGTVVAKALATGEARTDLSLSSGPRSEVRANSDSGPVGSWSGPDGVAHAISNHNLMTDSAWFFPAFTLGRLVASPNYVISYVGEERRASQSVVHLTAFQQFTELPTQFATLMQHLSQMEIFLDPSTLLPVALGFNVHPDGDAGLDIPIEIHFSDYRAVNGVQVPLHVQKYLNNGLVLDLQFGTVAFNTGLNTVVFSVQ